MSSKQQISPECPVGEKACPYIAELLERRAEVEQLAELVHSDTLTGLFNYRHFNLMLGQELERTQRSGQPTALIMLDLDHFKQVNDHHGHEAGNRVLQHVAALIKQQLRRIDIPCRYGGEEFALILPGTPLPRAVQAAKRLREVLAETPAELDTGPLAVTASLGVDIYQRESSLSQQHFVQQVDELLYQAKRDGRNRVVHADLEKARSKGHVGPDEKAALFGPA
jgi:diguanylate cyclase (GGDEF)-like protein